MDADEERRVIGFCGHCVHFDLWPLGGGADCRRGHDVLHNTREARCVDRTTAAAGEGPAYDLSE